MNTETGKEIGEGTSPVYRILSQFYAEWEGGEVNKVQF
jgi:hypothetical protein